MIIIIIIIIIIITILIIIILKKREIILSCAGDAHVPSWLIKMSNYLVIFSSEEQERVPICRQKRFSTEHHGPSLKPFPFMPFMTGSTVM